MDEVIDAGDSILMAEQLPKVYYPGSKDRSDPTKPKTLIPSTPDELAALLRIGWKVVEQ